MEVQFFLTSDDKRKLNKNLTSIISIDCELIDETTMLRPTLVLSGENMNGLSFNYCFIPRFNRYYFTKNPTLQNGNDVLIPCEVDVLMSNRTQISSISTVIERQENIYSAFMIDNMLPTRIQRQLTLKKVGNIGNPSGNYIALTVTGGE